MATTKGKVTLEVEVAIEIFCDTCGEPLIAFQAVNSVKDKKYLSVCPCDVCRKRNRKAIKAVAEGKYYGV